MHYHVEVAVMAMDRVGAIQAATEALAPFKDEHWDWFQIGGRWRGTHVAGRTIKPGAKICWRCLGSGLCSVTPPFPSCFAPDEGRLCAACNGAGLAVPWPTEWDAHPLDACRLADATPSLVAHALVSDGEWRDIEGVFPLPLPWENPPGDLWLVTMDCHD